jgi:hypothetical protein
MVSSIGYKLNQYAPISGFGHRRVVRRRPATGGRRKIHHARGTGIVSNLARRAISSLIKSQGHRLIDLVASKVHPSGGRKRGRPRKPRLASGFRVTGSGIRRRRVTRKIRII